MNSQQFPTESTKIEGGILALVRKKARIATFNRYIKISVATFNWPIKISVATFN